MTKKHRERLTDEEERDLAIKCRSGDLAARDRLIESQSDYVYKLSKRFKEIGISRDDIVQEGFIGLMRAAEKFDPHSGFRFATYAYAWIVSFMARAKQGKSSLVRYPEHLQDGRGGRPIAILPSVFSIDAPTAGDKGHEPDDYHTVVDHHDHIAETDDTDENRSDIEQMRLAMNMLTQQEQDIIKGCFGIERAKPMTINQQVKHHHRVPNTIKKMRAGALAKLRKAMLV